MLLRKLGFIGSKNNQAILYGRGSRYVLNLAWHMALCAMLAARILGPACMPSLCGGECRGSENVDGQACMALTDTLHVRKIMSANHFTDRNGRNGLCY